MIPQVGQRVTAINTAFPVTGHKERAPLAAIIGQGEMFTIAKCRFQEQSHVWILEFTEMIDKFPNKKLYYYSSAFVMKAVENPIKMWDFIIKDG